MNTQRGSAIIMLFVAVALFAALAFAFTRGSRTSTGFLTQEQAKSKATELINVSNSVRQAVKRLQLRGCKDNQLNFANNVYTHVTTGNPTFPEGHNPNAPADGRCDVYKTTGGGVMPMTIQNVGIENMGGAFKVGENGPAIFTVIGVGTSEPDLVLYYSKIDQTICKKINQLLGIPNYDTIPNDEYGSIWKAYSGSNTNFNTGPYETVGDESTVVVGKQAFCIKNTSSNSYSFQTVLIAR